MVRTVAAIAVAITLTSATAHAETTDEKLCVLASAQKVPPIPGLIVTGGRVTGLARPGMMNVEIDVKAVGRDATYGFLCGNGGSGSVFLAQPTGLIR
jgi:hypothetical protein